MVPNAARTSLAFKDVLIRKELANERTSQTVAPELSTNFSD